jgi:hypothetical protein
MLDRKGCRMDRGRREKGNWACEAEGRLVFFWCIVPSLFITLTHFLLEKRSSKRLTVAVSNVVLRQ